MPFIFLILNHPDDDFNEIISTLKDFGSSGMIDKKKW